MRLKHLFCQLVALILPLSALADCDCPLDDDCCIDWQCGWDAEIRSAYVYPTNHLVQEIYSGASWDVEIQASKHLWDRWDVWANFSYLSKHGHSVGLGDPTTLRLYPLSLGVSYIFPLTCYVDLYAGLGVNYTWMHLINDPVAVPSVKKSHVGATVKTGFFYYLADSFFADAFIDYLYIPMHLTNANNVGGFRFGLGVGYEL